MLKSTLDWLICRINGIRAFHKVMRAVFLKATAEPYLEGEKRLRSCFLPATFMHHIVREIIASSHLEC